MLTFGFSFGMRDLERGLVYAALKSRASGLCRMDYLEGTPAQRTPSGSRNFLGAASSVEECRAARGGYKLVRGSFLGRGNILGLLIRRGRRRGAEVGVARILLDHALRAEERSVQRHGRAHDGDIQLAPIVVSGQDLLFEFLVEGNHLGAGVVRILRSE